MIWAELLMMWERELGSFSQKMLRTTMDVDCSEWLDFFHGRYSKRFIISGTPGFHAIISGKLKTLFGEYCCKVDIPYATFTFVDGNKEVIPGLADVAKQVKMMMELCRKSIIRRASSTDHH